MTNDQIHTMVRGANPVPDLDVLDPIARLVPPELERSSEMTQIETIPEAKPRGRSRGPLIAAALAAVLLIATIGILLTNNDEQPAVAPVVATTVQVVPTTAPVVPTTIATLSGITTEEALSVADSYFTAFNAGDADAVMGLFTSDVVISSNFGGEEDPAEWEQLLASDTAQGTTHPLPECRVTEQTSENSTVVCVTATIDGVSRTTNSSGVPTTITMTVTNEGVSDLSFRYGQPDFTEVGGPFEDWMDVQFPDDPHAADFGNWTSIDEAEQYGLLRVERADEWVVFATGAVEQTFADFNAGDLDGVLARFSTLTVNLEGGRENAGEFFTAQMAADTQYRLDLCAPNGAGSGGILIECEFTTTDGAAGSVVMRVNQGTITFIKITND